VQAASALGADAAALVAATGFDPATAADGDARIAFALEERLWNEAARLTGDVAFGLHAAELIRKGAFDVLDYAARTAPTLRAAIERLIRYNRLVHDVAEFQLLERGDEARLLHRFRATEVAQCRHSAEYTMAAIVVIGGQLLGEPLRPHAVEFRHARPASDEAMAEHVRVFGVEPRFARPSNAVVLERALLERPVVGADPGLSRVIERHAEALLAARPRTSETTADRARRVLAGALGEGYASLGAVAAKLRMSARSLQRKLAGEGVTFDALVDDLRRDLALRYLADPKIAVAEVAYLLGYSEPSPFHRAFKRWTGLTPTEARRRAA